MDKETISYRRKEMKSVSKRSAIIIVLIIVIASVVSYSRYLDYKHNWYIPDYPTEGLNNEVFYIIDPNTILTSIDLDERDVFRSAPDASHENVPALWPAGSFAWDQYDFIKVANALHQFIWKEPLDNWQLIRSSFLMDQCQDISGRFDYASMLFYQRQGDKYVVHGLRVDLLYGQVEAGDNNYHYTSKWENLDLGNLTVNSADLALLLADGHGGREARLAVKGECSRVDLFFAPWVYEYDFWSKPFNRYEWGWRINYYDKAENVIFEIIIDSFTGKYKIINVN